MDRLYQRTFDQIHLPEERAAVVRKALASRCSQTEQEVIPMKHFKRLPRPVTAAAALILVFALSATAFAYGQRFYSFMSGGSVQDITDENGQVIGVQGSVDPDLAVPPVELRDDGRLYLTANGENADITGLCSDETPYIYECTGSDGLRDTFIIGGEPDAVGWAEFIWDEDGLPTAGTSQFATPEGRDGAPWFDAAMEQLNLPW